MIKYKLVCSDCKTSFDSWFASSKEYEKLKNKNFLICYNCNSKKVKKTLMSPQLINSKNKSRDSLEPAKYNNVKKTIKEAMTSISNSEYHMFTIPLEVNVNSGYNWGEAH